MTDKTTHKKGKDIVSIYMPTHPKSNSKSIQEDKIRYKNALQELKNLVSDNKELQSTYLELEKLSEDIDFWKTQNKSLAIFADNESIELYKLPFETSFKVTITEHDMRTPALAAKELQTNVVVLDLSLNHIRGFINNYNNEPEELDIDVLDMDEYLEQDHQDNQQFHNPSGKRSASPQFHGHGGSDDQSSIETELYLQYVAREVKDELKNLNIPVILSGEKNRVEQFRKLAQIEDELGIDMYGNSENESIHELNDTVNDKLSNVLEQALNTQAKELMVKNSDKKLFSSKEIYEAAEISAVEKLYVPLLRKTRDSVRPGLTDSTIFDLDIYDEKLEKLINTIRGQGGKILPVFQDTLKNNKMLAELRF